MAQLITAAEKVMTPLSTAERSPGRTWHSSEGGGKKNITEAAALASFLIGNGLKFP